jgi:fatty acid desaturase
LLICTVQFLIVTRGAQIDAVLCLLTTLSLYGLLRHLMLGPAWGWYFVGGLAAGLGVITKGVGFLPLLILLPYAALRARGFEPLPQFTGGARWSLAAFGFLAGIAVWLVPMVLAVARTADPQLIAYRDGILFQQTVERYAAAWHHVRPWYYYLIEVIPPLWFPSSLLLFWLVPRLMGEPVMRWIRVTEHVGCEYTADLRRNTRTTRPSLLLRGIFWNMSYHAEHHLCPAVPFHALAALHREAGHHLHEVGSGYLAVHREVLTRTLMPRLGRMLKPGRVEAGAR